jgi:hypothetical protein
MRLNSFGSTSYQLAANRRHHYICIYLYSIINLIERGEIAHTRNARHDLYFDFFLVLLLFFAYYHYRYHANVPFFVKHKLKSRLVDMRYRIFMLFYIYICSPGY